MTRWYSDYPGLDGRLGPMRGLIDQMAAESRTKYGRSIDLALFTEYAVTAGKPGPAAKVGVPLDDRIIKALGSQAREQRGRADAVVKELLYRGRPGTLADAVSARGGDLEVTRALGDLVLVGTGLMLGQANLVGDDCQ